VRVLVQNCSTLEYLCSERGWVRNPAQAIDFQKTALAVEYCVRQKVRDAQLVLKFGEDPQLDILLPVRMPDVPVAIPGRKFAAA
jgi:hypothetical protein